jgi:hypothetical protein
MFGGEVCTEETIIHCLKRLKHRLLTLRMNLLAETKHLKDRQIVIPQFNACVEYKPTLFWLLTKLDCFDNMFKEQRLQVFKFNLFFLGELSFLGFFNINADKLGSANLNVFFQQIFNIAFRQINMRTALCNNQVCVLNRVPMLLDT